MPVDLGAEPQEDTAEADRSAVHQRELARDLHPARPLQPGEEVAPLALVMIAVHRPVKPIAGGVQHPALQERGEDRMFDGKQEAAADGQRSRDGLDHGLVVVDVLERHAADDDIEPVRRRLEILHGLHGIQDCRIVGRLPCRLDHPVGDIDAENFRRSHLTDIAGDMTKAASHVQHPLSGQIGHQGADRRFLHHLVQAGFTPAQAAIAFEEQWIVVNILFRHSKAPDQPPSDREQIGRAAECLVRF